MTDNRKFKKLVREYMDKYNLTYTEALKRVKNIHQIVPLSSYFNKTTIETIVSASTRSGLLLISGLTSTGKTTLLNSITNELAKSDRFIINIHNSNHQPKEVLKNLVSKLTFILINWLILLTILFVVLFVWHLMCLLLMKLIQPYLS